MDLPRVPSVFIGGRAAMADLFQEIGRRRGLRAEEVAPIVGLLPEELLKAPCFLDRLARLWRYDFGAPYVGVRGGGAVLGTHMWQPVEILYEAMTCVRNRLAPAQLTTYLQRLVDPLKHEDALAEFAPIVRLVPEVLTEFEVAGHGEGDRTIDWLIRPPTGTPILLDVKNRVRDLLETIARLQAGESDPDGSAPAPTHDPAILLRSLEQKFRQRPPEEFVQAGWIMSSIMQEEAEWERAFARLDPTRVHAVALGNWGDGARILARHPWITARIAEVLRLRDSDGFTFRRHEATRAAIERTNRKDEVDS